MSEDVCKIKYTEPLRTKSSRRPAKAGCCGTLGKVMARSARAPPTLRSSSSIPSSHKLVKWTNEEESHRFREVVVCLLFFKNKLLNNNIKWTIARVISTHYTKLYLLLIRGLLTKWNGKRIKQGFIKYQISVRFLLVCILFVVLSGILF